MPMGPWFLSPHPLPEARFRLFCFPHAGGGVATYRSWPHHLAADIEVRAVQMPGRDGRMDEAPFTSMPALVEAMAEAIAPHVGRPYGFFGHSMGAVVAFELVRRLRARGQPPPVHLFVAAHRAPHVPDREPPCHRLPEAAFVDHLVRRYNAIPRAILAEPALMNLFVPILRADFTLLESYRFPPGEPLDQPITVFGGAHDPVTTADDLRAWRDMTRGPFDLHVIAGGHFFVQESEAEVLRIVANQMDPG
jgi:medium-chain acyl-[acyl-carrier-protein] hydrolase